MQITGNEIRDQRRGAGVTIAVLGRRLGLSYAQLQAMEKGALLIPASLTAERVAEAIQELREIRQHIRSEAQRVGWPELVL